MPEVRVSRAGYIAYYLNRKRRKRRSTQFTPPEGYVFLVDAEGYYLTDIDGYYLVGAL